MLHSKQTPDFKGSIPPGELQAMTGLDDNLRKCFLDKGSLELRATKSPAHASSPWQKMVEMAVGESPRGSHPQCRKSQESSKSTLSSRCSFHLVRIPGLGNFAQDGMLLKSPRKREHSEPGKQTHPQSQWGGRGGPISRHDHQRSSRDLLSNPQ